MTIFHFVKVRVVRLEQALVVVMFRLTNRIYLALLFRLHFRYSIEHL